MHFWTAAAVLVLIFQIKCVHAIGGAVCGPNYKKAADGSCVMLENEDILRTLNWLSSPPKIPETQGCRNVTTVQGISICEDLMAPDGDCLVWSSISTSHCNAYGTLEFEKYWSKRCKVVIFHYMLPYAGNSCEFNAKPDLFSNNGKKTRRGKGDGEGIVVIPGYPNIKMKRYGIWSTKKFNALYEDIGKIPLDQKVDILKIQGRSGDTDENLDGVQYTTMSDLFLHKPTVVDDIGQIVFTASINTNTLSDNVGREAEHAWNMWGTRQFLQDFASFSSIKEEFPSLQPLQFSHLLDQARVSPQYSFYHHSFMKVKDEVDKEKIRRALEEWKPATPDHPIVGEPPRHCSVPSKEDDEEMQRWIRVEMRSRCHPTQLWVPCERDRTYDSFVPCPEELANNLAEDYAAMKKWCDFTLDSAAVPQLVRVEPEASGAFKRVPLERGVGVGGTKVRLAFFFTVYADEVFFRRLLSRLYSPEHYYLIHVDPSGATKEYKKAIKVLAEEYNNKIEGRTHKNVFICSDVPIVYGASTATIVLSKALSWFARETSGWDYFVPVTGSDYPLVPLPQLEKMLGHLTAKDAARPFVMAWTPGTSTHMFRLSKTVPAFEFDPDLTASIKAVTSERGRVLGAVPMEYRSTNFGPPLFCNGGKTFHHLDNRRNKSGTMVDTQWLFPRDIQRGRGRAYSDWDPAMASPSFDNGWRIWKKSDPATTAIYDKVSVDYIANSVEGRKYYHFFKHMLLGSEEHYYVSLLYNWPRTQAFVQTLSAQAVWNTWELGSWPTQSAGFKTHTHFLTLKEWPQIVGFAKRGMVFARKFNSRETPELLDAIDAYIHNNASTDAGSMWPGFFEVDTWSPGKIWVGEYRKNQSIAAELRRQEKQKQLDARRKQMARRTRV